jgi:hypothetical protein
MSVCLSVCLRPLQQNKGVGEEKERKKKFFLSQTKCLSCVLFWTQKRKIFLCNNEQKKIKTRQWVLDFFLSSSRRFCNLQTH